MERAWMICREIDLARDFVGVERLAALATTSAKAAHKLRIAVKSGGAPIDMDSASVSLNLILPDGVSTEANGSIEEGACVAMLPSLCYQRGDTQGVLMLNFGTEANIPVYAFVLRCFEDITDVFVDPDQRIPSIKELLEQIEVMKTATENANAAAKNASDQAMAAQEATEQAALWSGATATADALDPGSTPTVNVTTEEDGERHLHFGIPTGATPKIAVSVATGEPGTMARVDQGGTAEMPTLLFTIPRGEKGDGVLYNQDQTLTDDQKAQARRNIGAAFDSDVNALKIDPSAYGIPVLYLRGDISQMSKDTAVTLNYVYGERAGTLTCKWQGHMSLIYDKKNYTIVFDEAFEAKEGWGEQKKYCLKANWVDASNLRNIYGAVIWGQMVKDRSGADTRLTALPNGGAIDGFPAWVIINGEPQGLYTWNIPKDAWLFGMTGSNAGEGFVCAENTSFTGTAVCDGTDFSVEYCASEDPAALIASLNNLITTVNNVESEDDLPALEALVDVNSVIDYYVFMATACHDDGMSRNYILATYDGTKWFMSAYDMDAIFGNSADGSGYGWANDWPMFTGVTGVNQLLDVVKTYYADQIRTRFTNLCYWFFGELSLQAELYKLAVKIPKALQDEDYRIWPTRPGTNTNNIGQIQEYMRIRMPVLDYNVTQM